MKIKKNLLLIALIGLLVAGLFGSGVVPLSIVGLKPGDFNTNTINSEPLWAIQSKGWFMGETELLDSGRYITGEVGASEKVVIEGMLTKGLSVSCVVDHRFDVYITNSNDWGSADFSFGSGALNVFPGTWTKTGAQILSSWTAESGWLKVELHFKIYDLCGTFPIDRGWQLMSTDMAYVRWGGAELSFDRTQYEVGETATIHYKVAFARSAKTDSPGLSQGWSFSLFSYAQGRQVHTELIPGPNPDGSDGNFVENNIYYTIQPEDFRSGGCSAGANNKLEATLYNNLVFTESVVSTTIDERRLAPPAPSITLDSTEYFIGDSLIIQAVADPNPTTQIPICGMNIRILYDEGGVELVDINLVGDAVEYRYNNLPASGIVKIEIFSWDENARTSAIASASINVLDPEREGDVEIDIFFLVLVMVILAIVAIVILFPLPGIKRLPLNVRAWIAVLLFGIDFGLIVWFFIVPVVVAVFQGLFPFLTGG